MAAAVQIDVETFMKLPLADTGVDPHKVQVGL